MSKWHARYHRSALDGMQSLTLEERGAYNTILDLIYDREGPLPDDPRWLAGWMGVSLRKWATLRATLIVKGKLYVTPDGRLANVRADFEIENAANLTRNRSESGAKGGRNRAEKAANSNKNSGVAQAGLKLIDNNSTSTTEGEKSPSVARKRGSRLPEDWMPSAEDLDYAIRLGFGGAQIERIVERFRNFWHAKAGASAVKLDWSKTWRNWVSNEAERNPPQPRPAQRRVGFV